MNVVMPERRQIWKHVVTGIEILVLRVDEDTEYAQCAIMSGHILVSKLRVQVPLTKFRFYGNRGLCYSRVWPGNMPVAKDSWSEFNPRLQNLGAK